MICQPTTPTVRTASPKRAGYVHYKVPPASRLECQTKLRQQDLTCIASILQHIRLSKERAVCVDVGSEYFKEGALEFTMRAPPETDESHPTKHNIKTQK